MSTEPKNYPSHDVFVVVGEKDAADWTKVGAAWPTKNGTGLTITIQPGIAVSGRLVLTAYEPKKKNAE